MEIVWDKGSSGLVFYTDGNYWADLEGKGAYNQLFNGYTVKFLASKVKSREEKTPFILKFLETFIN